MKRLWPVLALLAACDTLPRDTEHTLGRVQAAHRMRIGLIADPRADRAATGRLVSAIEQRAGAQATVVPGATEPLLAALDEGQVDVVIGAWTKKTPWSVDVTLTPPIARYTVGETPIEVRAAVKNGENRWAMLVEQAARATVKASGQR